MTDKTIEQLVLEKNVKVLCYVLFGKKLTHMQERIVRAIAFRESPRITIKAYTQYGKTMCVALGVCLHKIMNDGNKYRLIASQDSKTAILRNYIVEFTLKYPALTELLDLEASGIARLHKEVSRRRLTYKDGDDLIVLSAEGDAMRLMGHGGNIIIIDESGEIDPPVYREKISRMTAGYPDDQTLVVEIGNPWDPNSHFAEHWDDPRTPNQGGWMKFHIPWHVGVAEGRVTQKFIDERREELRTNPVMFRILWDAEFPGESEDQLVRREWWEKAENKDFKIDNAVMKAGCDVAELGIDESVAFEGKTDGRLFQPLRAKAWEKMDTMQSVAMLRGFLTTHGEETNIDSTGVGAGVSARMRELGYNAVAYKGGEKPTSPQDHERFKNLLAQLYWQVRDAFESERIDLHMLKAAHPAEHAKLKQQLLSIRYEIQSDRLVRIIKPDDKSPDYADAFMLFIGKTKTFAFGFG